MSITPRGVWSTSFLLLTAAAALAQCYGQAKDIRGCLTGQITSASELRGKLKVELTNLDRAEGSAIVTLETPAEDDLRPYVDVDGIRLLLLRFKSTNAAGLRLHFRNLRLPADGTLFVYGVDSSGQATDVRGPYRSTGPLRSGEFWSPPILGTDAVVELQFAGEVPPTLPLDIVEVALLNDEALARMQLYTSGAAAETQADSQPSIRTSWFRNSWVKHEVRGEWAVLEDDILLGRAAELAVSATPIDKSRKNDAVAVTAEGRWPNGIIPYQINADVPDPGRINAAIDYWNTTLAGTIRFVSRTTEPNYILFRRESGCYSYVGMTGGEQPMFAGDYCGTLTLIHELGHAVGLWHEQQREDRNSHIKVFYENINPAYTYAFDQQISGADDVNSYDYSSAMHYTAYSFSINGLPTMETIPAGIPIGQYSGLSAGDIASVKTIYGQAVPPPSPPTSSVTISSNPAGRQLIVDGVPITAPQTFNWIAGTQHSVSAPNSPVQAGTRHIFSNWSNGGAQTQLLIVASTSPVYTAFYSTQYQVDATVSPSATGKVSVSPVSADGFYAQNTAVTVTAVPNAGYCFAGWTGLVPGTGAQAAFTVTKPYALAASMIAGDVTLPTSRMMVSKDAASYSLAVTANAGCAWTVSTAETWLRISSPVTNQGSASVSFSVTANTGTTARSGVIRIGNQDYVVEQAAPATAAVAVTVSSYPAGRQLLVDGVAITAPQIFSWAVGSQHSIGAPNSTLNSGTRYLFLKWSNGGPQTQTITVGSTGVSYSANYVEQHSVTASVSPLGTGTVSVSPASADKYYAVNSTVTATATPSAGYCFSDWAGLPSGTTAQITFSVTKPLASVASMSPVTVTLGAPQITVARDAGTYSLAVFSGSDCVWATRTSATWIHLTSSPTSRGAAVVTFNVDYNKSPWPRTDVIQIGDKSYFLTQAGRKPSGNPGSKASRPGRTHSGKFVR